MLLIFKVQISALAHGFHADIEPQRSFLKRGAAKTSDIIRDSGASDRALFHATIEDCLFGISGRPYRYQLMRLKRL